MKHFGPRAHVFLAAMPELGPDAPGGVAVTSFSVVLTMDTGERSFGPQETVGGPAGGPYRARVVSEHTLGKERAEDGLETGDA